MGFNRQAQPPSQPQPQRKTAPTRPQRQMPQRPQMGQPMQPGQSRPQMQRPTRPGGAGMRPQRPAGMDARVQALRNRQPMQRPQMGRTPDYQNRRAQRQQQFANMPQPSAAKLADMKFRRSDPGSYEGLKKYGEQDNISSKWTSDQGVITNEGHRITADALRDKGYTYSTGSDGMTYGGGDNFHQSGPVIKSGWNKGSTMVGNPAWNDWNRDNSGGGDNWGSTYGQKAPQKQISLTDYNKLQAEKKANKTPWWNNEIGQGEGA